MSTSRKRSQTRGQNIVLFSLTGLLLTVLVCMTLSIGTKAREKMELQQVADQAAYSNAVAVARTFNVLAMHNRLIVAHNIAVLGVQSSISFTTSWAGYVWSLFLKYSTIELARQCPPSCPFSCTCWGCPFFVITRLIPVLIEWIRILGMSAVDAAAGGMARRASRAAELLYASEVLSYTTNLVGVGFGTGALNNQKLAGNVMSQASGGAAEWVNPGGGADDVAKEEVGLIPIVDGAVNLNKLPFLSDRHAVFAAHSARTFPWLVNRGAPWPVVAILPPGFPTPNGRVEAILGRAFRRVVGNDMGRFGWHEGSSYFGPVLHSRSPFVVNSAFANADDHGCWDVRYRGPGCGGSFLPLVCGFAFVQSSAVLSMHSAGPALLVPPPIPGPGPDIWLMLGIPLPPFIGLHTPQHAIQGGLFSEAFSDFVDYNWVRVAFRGDNFAQPKQPVALVRDYTQRGASMDPFNLFFNFRFSSAGAGQTIDMKSSDGITMPDGTPLSRSVALGTGIAYYHRASGNDDHWREPPNLFNPFWRAGLTRADVDDEARLPGGNDIPRVLNGAGAGWATQAVQDLEAVGYEGW